MVLPIIKGLEAPLPEEGFFDDGMMQRVDEASKKDKSDKSSRNIPKKKPKKVTPKSTTKPVLTELKKKN